jgi:hypothetical protein
LISKKDDSHIHYFSYIAKTFIFMKLEC